MRRRTVYTVVTLVTLLWSCDEGETVVMPNPDDPVASTAPLVTVIYDPDALGDRSYNDLIYQGVEEAAQRYGLRTMQLSPQTVAEGETYIETLFSQLAAATDTVRRLTIVAGSSYDTLLRRSNSLLEQNSRAALLYLETDTPLEGKGSTLYLPYYGAMYEAGAVTPVITSNTLVIGANPEDQTVGDAIAGFCDGYDSGYFEAGDAGLDHSFVVTYLADHAGQGYNVEDSMAIRLICNVEKKPVVLVPICGGSSTVFCRLADILGGGYFYMGVDRATPSLFSYYSVVKHIDRAVDLCISQWLSSEGMPKHQRLGLASGYTEMVVHPTEGFVSNYLNGILTDESRAALHEEAVRRERLRMEN